MFASGMERHRYWSIIADFYSTTHDFARNDKTKIQNVLWELEPGEKNVNNKNKTLGTNKHVSKIIYCYRLKSVKMFRIYVL